MRGKLWVVEGIDGTGKTSLVSGIARHLESLGEKAVTTREETDTWLGESVRRSIEEGLDPLATLHFFLADRAQHARWIAVQLDQGTHVVTDRYTPSSYAYQGVTLAERFGSRIDEFLDDAHSLLPIEADHVLVLDLDVEKALLRVQGRGAAAPYEKQTFLEKVRARYLDLADKRGWDLQDASGSPEEVLRAARAWVDAKIHLERTLP